MSALCDELTLPRGAVVTCPNPYCGDRIAATRRDLKPGDRLTSDLFDQSEGQGLRVDKRCQCKRCNHHWFVNEKDLVRLHTARGWFPTEPQIVAAMEAAVLH